MKTTSKIIKDNRREYDKLIKSLKVLKSGHVNIGVLEKDGTKEHKSPMGGGDATIAEIATWNEFGTKKIPERPFMRGAADENKEAIGKIKENLYAEVKSGSKTSKQALQSLGFKFKEMVRSRIMRSMSWATPSADSTVAGKASRGNPSPNRPLIDTGLLLRSIDYEVKG